MLDDFYHKIDGKYTLPKNGLNSNDISYYMNSSKNPNISFKNGGCNMISFYSIRAINKGEELLIDYDKIDDMHHSYHENVVHKILHWLL